MILITRPKKESLNLKAKLDKDKIPCIVDSLSSFVKVKSDLIVSNSKIVLISSPRAAQIVIEDKSLTKQINFLIIGARSQKKLREAGYKNIIFTSQNSDQMLKYIKLNFTKIKKFKFKNILYLTSSVGNITFQKKLIKMGVQVKVIYRTAYKKSLRKDTINLIKKNQIDVCLVFSQENAKLLIKLFKKHKLMRAAKSVTFLSMGRKISLIFMEEGFASAPHVLVPTERRMISKLNKLLVMQKCH